MVVDESAHSILDIYMYSNLVVDEIALSSPCFSLLWTQFAFPPNQQDG